jgi:hypothetical protein
MIFGRYLDPAMVGQTPVAAQSGDRGSRTHVTAAAGSGTGSSTNIPAAAASTATPAAPPAPQAAQSK